MIMVSNGLWDVEPHLRRTISAGGAHFRVDDAGDVQDDIVIVWILVMTMKEPVARLVMYLHIAYPQRAVNLYLCVEEIGPALLLWRPGR